MAEDRRAGPGDHPEIRVRSATPGDAGRLAPLFDAYRRFYGQHGDEAAARRFLHDRLTAGESVVLWAAGPQAAALGLCQLYPSFTSVGLARIWILNDLFVHPDARRRGVAWRLLEAARAHARRGGARRLDLATAATNTRAQALYERFGYQRNEGFWQYSLRL